MLECVEQIKGPKQLYIASLNRLNHDRLLKMHVVSTPGAVGIFLCIPPGISDQHPHPPSHPLLLSIFVNICALNL